MNREKLLIQGNRPRTGGVSSTALELNLLIFSLSSCYLLQRRWLLFPSEPPKRLDRLVEAVRDKDTAKKI
jgi:hypothetical protein